MMKRLNRKQVRKLINESFLKIEEAHPAGRVFQFSMNVKDGDTGRWVTIEIHSGPGELVTLVFGNSMSISMNPSDALTLCDEFSMVAEGMTSGNDDGNLASMDPSRM